MAARALEAHVLPRLDGPSLRCMAAVSVSVRDAVLRPSFRPWEKAAARAEVVAKHRCERDAALRARRGDRAGTATEARLWRLNEVCDALRGAAVGWPRPPAGFWRALPGAAPAATGSVLVFARIPLDASERAGVAAAHAAASIVVARALGTEPDAEPWAACAAFVLCCASAVEMLGALAAIEHALAAPNASCVVRELSARLRAALVDGSWDRVALHRRARWPRVLLTDVARASALLAVVAPAFRRPRPPPAVAGLTAEQDAYAAIALTPRSADSDLVVVEAYAGTGKTHATLEFVRRRASAGTRVLVAYYNKSMAAEANSRLSGTPHCDCATLDALVYKDFVAQDAELAARIFHDVSTSGPNYTAKSIRRVLGVADGAIFKGTLASHTRRVLHAFLVSTDDAIAPASDPRHFRIQQWWAGRKKAMPPFHEYAARLWRGLISLEPAHADLKLSFEELAKVFEIRARLDADRPRLAWMLGARPTVLDRVSPFTGTAPYAFVVVDEAQDLNAPHYELFVAAPRRGGQRVAHVIVGDPFQSLYGWRGAKNMLKTAAPSARAVLPLTRSFRFGGAVAALATAVLRDCGDPDTRPLLGRAGAAPGNLHFRNGLDCHDWRDAAAPPLAVLGRTNKAVFLEAEAYAAAAEADGLDAAFLFVRGVDHEKQGRLLAKLVALRDHPDAEETFGEDRGSFAVFCQLVDEDAVDDAELKHAIDLCRDTVNPVEMSDRIRAFSVADATDARVVVSTIHQMKGLEQGAVRLLDDVPGCTSGDDHAPQGLSSANLCLIYTALTRARDDLYMPASLRNLWLRRRPPRPVLRALDPAGVGGVVHSWCGCCGFERPLDAGDAGLYAAFHGLRAAPSHTPDAGICENCAMFRDLQPPLAFEAAGTDSFHVCGWRFPSPPPPPTRAEIGAMTVAELKAALAAAGDGGAGRASLKADLKARLLARLGYS